MKLDKTDEYLKNSLEAIMNGDWDNHFDESQLEMAKKTAFLLNHLNANGTKITFEYDGKKTVFSYDCDPTDLQLYSGDANMHLMSMIKNDDSFLKAYTAFIRDWKIKKIIDK